MDINLLGNIIKNIAVLGVAAYLTAQLMPFRRALNRSQYRWKDKLILIGIFGFFSGLGNYLSVPILGALAHTRLVGVIVGGLLGGPVVGLGAGVLGAIPRCYMSGYGEYVLFPAVLSNILIGGFTGMVCQKYGARYITIKLAFFTALVSEAILKILVLTLSTSQQDAIALERVIAGPSIMATSLGVMLFIYIVRDVFLEQEKIQFQAAQQAMRVILAARDVFRHGLNEVSADKVAQILYQEIKSDAVAITDQNKILAFVGEGADHHVVGQPFITRATKQAMESGQTVIVNDKKSIGCPVPSCPFRAVIDAPLLVNGRFVGSIKLYKAGQESILPYEAELIQGIASFLSLELLQAELNEQTVLLAQAEYNSLKSQIHPHFLFNTLGTIRAIVRTDPGKARTLIKDLSDFLRRHIKPGKENISVQEEMECVETYLRLEQARFGDRITVLKEIQAGVLEQIIPVFSIQVLVENAVKHGLSPKKDGGAIRIKAWQADGHLHVRVEDNGIGIPAERLAAIKNMEAEQQAGEGIGIGLKNVHVRLQKFSGISYGLSIESDERQGTRAGFLIPWVSGGGVVSDETY